MPKKVPRGRQNQVTMPPGDAASDEAFVRQYFSRVRKSIERGVDPDTGEPTGEPVPQVVGFDAAAFRHDEPADMATENFDLPAPRVEVVLDAAKPPRRRLWAARRLALAEEPPVELVGSVECAKTYEDFRRAACLLRARMGLNRIDFGARIGVSQATVANIELGYTFPSRTTVNAFVHMTEKDYHDLQPFFTAMVYFQRQRRPRLS